jgi:hypothetical protein
MSLIPTHSSPQATDKLCHAHNISPLHESKALFDGKTFSTDSTATQHGQTATAPTDPTLLAPAPLRQISLDILKADESKNLDTASDRQYIFKDEMDHLNNSKAIDDAFNPNSTLFTLPSMDFLETLLSDMDAKLARSGRAPAEPPIMVPIETFDLPGDRLKPTPFDMVSHPSHNHHRHQQPPPAYNISASALANHPIAMPASVAGPFIHMGENNNSLSHSTIMSGHSTQQHHYSNTVYQHQEEHLPQLPHMQQPCSQQQQQYSAAAAYMRTNDSNGPQSLTTMPHPGGIHAPVPSRMNPNNDNMMMMMHKSQSAVDAAYYHQQQQQSSYNSMVMEGASEPTLQMSKSGRVRKVQSFTGGGGGGNSRQRPYMSELDTMHHHVSAPAAIVPQADYHNSYQPYQPPHPSESGNTAATTTTTTTSSGMAGDSTGPDGIGKSKRGKSKKGKKTTCLNCGCHQTPQWRCGPLGPRTLCNACGVRYKKGLPLNCWPLRDGMVFPQGAQLPSGFSVPEGINIVVQPCDSE